jgi:hypothetical protein
MHRKSDFGKSANQNNYFTFDTKNPKSSRKLLKKFASEVGNNGSENCTGDSQAKTPRPSG